MTAREKAHSDGDGDRQLARRDILKRGLVLGGGAGALVLGAGVGPAAAAGLGKGKGKDPKAFVFDVANLGDTLRVMPAPGASPHDMRGSTFAVEGSIYPANTIPKTAIPGSPGFAPFDPASVKAVGRWFCRGWIILSDERPAPFFLTTQEFVLGDIGAGHLYPPDNISTSGMEGNMSPDVPARSVTGGTGKYVGATGTSFQHFAGVNTTILDDGSGMNAPCLRFEFHLTA
jgi:hypothetical protein